MTTLGFQLLSNPIIYPTGKSKLDYVETFFIGSSTCDVMYQLLNSGVDNTVLKITDNQPIVDGFQYSTLITRDLNAENFDTIGRTMDTTYSLSDKFYGKTIEYLSTTDSAPSQFFITRISRTDGKSLILPSVVNEYTAPTIRKYLVDHADEPILCVLIASGAEILWNPFPNSDKIVGETYTREDGLLNHLLMSISYGNYIGLDPNTGIFSIYYESTATSEITGSNDAIQGTPYTLNTIPEADALALMGEFYGYSDLFNKGYIATIYNESSA
jgi:hypothetical protein